jgi:predicted naringenin-chalcone synthase
MMHGHKLPVWVWGGGERWALGGREHLCIHIGGCGIIDGLEKELKLSRSQVEPCRAALYRFGNTSSTRWGWG